MRALLLMLLLAGCVQNAGDRSSVTPYVHGAYTTLGGAVLSR